MVVLRGGAQSMRTIFVEGSPRDWWLDLATRHGLLMIVPNGWSTSENSGRGDRQTRNDLGPTDGRGISERDDAGFIVASITAESLANGDEAVGFADLDLVLSRVGFPCPD